MSAGRTTFVKLVFVVIVIVIAVGGLAYLLKSRPAKPTIAAEEAEWPVNAKPLNSDSYAPVITLFGRVESPLATQLVAAINADVLAVPTHEADHVTAGQLLVELDDTEAKLSLEQRDAELAEAKALLSNEQSQHSNNQLVLNFEQELLALAEKELSRSQRLNKDQLAAQNLIDSSRQSVITQQISIAQRQLAIDSYPANLSRLKAAVEKARAQRDLASLDVERSEINAPFSGVITDLHVVPGMRVRIGDPLVDLYDESSLEVRAQVPVSQLDLLRSALENNLLLTAQLSAAQSGQQSPPALRLTRITAAIKNSQSSVDALFSLTSNSPFLAQGQVLKLFLRLPPQSNVFTVPAEAIYGDKRIFSISEQRLRSHIVERVGLTYNANGEEQVILRSTDLNDGDLLLTTQLPNAIDGLKVRILDAQ